MLIHELTSAECVEVLSRTHLGRLGCARSNQPYVVPIHFSFDVERHCVYSFSTIGQKIDWMRENPKVCLEVEDITDKDHWTTVLVTGRYDEIHQAPEETDARSRAELLFQQRREWWLPAAAKVSPREHPDVVVYRIQIDRVTGRRASRDR
jgi:nitroimidazol reductase NimA-like FMN-containing flavoprotein (pyridoxamine 5'-phosphate oxidase superfamily)